MDVFAKNLISVDLSEEMRSSYMDYSMSVIIGRALPEARDGLKPVHRRILYAMLREGNLSNRRYSKCAGVVGEVLKKYHPHGDSAVYDALVRMAQPWNMRCPLVDGQGNFGSVDGDPAAAYRYTESRMTRLAELLLKDIDRDTVSFGPNFDGTTEEPEVLPASFPNLLVNGSDGIAVGMATKIPPHNLGEIIDGVIALIDEPEIDIAGLMELIPGPDFPTAGAIYGTEGIHSAYHTGRGKVVMRGRAFFEERDGGKWSLIIDQLPFQVNKARLVEEIATLVKTKRIDGITALRDESDRRGMRVVVELRRDVVREVVLNRLYKHTALQSTFGVILLAIVGKQPRVLNLKEALQCYLSHRRDVVVRRCRYLLRKAEARKHLLEGYRIALDNIDAVIELIRASHTPEQARSGLIERFGLTETQAQAILDLRLQRLTGMEREKIETEYRELEATIAELQAILGDRAQLMGVIREELLEVKERYADERRTSILEATGELSILDLIPSEQQVITLSVNGYIKRSSHDEYRMQRRGGRGSKGMSTRDEDSVREIFLGNTHSNLLVFTRCGRVYRLPVYTIPESGRGARGKPIVNLMNLEPQDEIAAVLSMEEFSEDLDLVFCSRRGLVKRTRFSKYRNLRSNGLIAYDCAEGDELLTVVLTRTDQHVLIVTKNGKSIRFPGDEIRHTGRKARGVRGIVLKEGKPGAPHPWSEDDEIVDLSVLEPDPDLLLLTISENGYGKRTPIDGADPERPIYRVQSRKGQGVINMAVDESTGRVAGSIQVHDDDLVMLMTDRGRVIKIPVVNIRETKGRASKGVRLMRIDPDSDERIVSVTRVVEEGDSDDGDAELMEETSESPSPEGEKG